MSDLVRQLVQGSDSSIYYIRVSAAYWWHASPSRTLLTNMPRPPMHGTRQQVLYRCVFASFDEHVLCIPMYSEPERRRCSRPSLRSKQVKFLLAGALRLCLSFE